MLHKVLYVWYSYFRHRLYALSAVIVLAVMQIMV